ncbi:hypothetical protein IU403_03490 [Aerococcaceae bacterium zg-BR22]|uniref:hypothetical protein n=1 Tax=Aerococcaceae bacterium zg-1292 TaxID=2774330 RepID=UPI004064822E|nr:hypothetical protein [Aerococcaceae bacterium zg-BR22]
MVAGLPDRQYKFGANDIVVVDGEEKVLHENVRAGSTLTRCQALCNIMEFIGSPIEKVIKLLTENSAKMLGIYDEIE